MLGSPETVLSSILAARGIKDVERFLYPDYERDSHDPLLLPDIQPALKRLVQAKRKQELVVIYGDYDIDGLCASALLIDAFSQFGLRTEAFIPNRFTDGYGLSTSALKQLARQGASLIVTVDCGSTAVKEIAAAQKAGLDVIVTDHHQPPEKLPPAVAVINPKRADSRYPFNDLAGNGVAFKLVQALQSVLPGLAVGQEKWLLDLVAFGTVCDVVSLTDENRLLVSKGLSVMAKSRRVGFQALAMVTGEPLTEVTTQTLGFIFGPRLNAAGRLAHAKTALELLTSTDMAQALDLAQKLERLNSERRIDQARIEREATVHLAALREDKVLVLAAEGWSHGIIGIVAARLLEKQRKPVFIMQKMGSTAKGSARSYGDFNAADALGHVRDLLISGGGHKAAAGFSLATKDIDEFRRRLNDYYRANITDNQEKHLESVADVSSTTLTNINLDLWRVLQVLQPYGQGNPEPLLELSGVTLIETRRVGADGTHLKVLVRDNAGAVIDGIAFAHDGDPPLKTPMRLIGRLERNEYRASVKPQLVIKRLTAL